MGVDMKWDDSHVQGKQRICKVLRESIASVGCSEVYGCKIVGIFGEGGIGKTTICNTLCNELSNMYEGRVCHIALETQATTSISLEVASENGVYFDRQGFEVCPKFVQNWSLGSDMVSERQQSKFAKNRWECT